MAIINISFFVFQVMMLCSGTNSYHFGSMKCTEIYAAGVKADKINGEITLVIVMLAISHGKDFFHPPKKFLFLFTLQKLSLVCCFIEQKMQCTHYLHVPLVMAFFHK